MGINLDARPACSKRLEGRDYNMVLSAHVSQNVSQNLHNSHELPLNSIILINVPIYKSQQNPMIVP